MVRVIGLMSGTSYDAVDAANVDFRYEGGELTGRVLWTGEFPLTDADKDLIAALLPPARVTSEQVLRADTALGQLFADAAESSVSQSGGADAICSHGQTIFHWVEDGAAHGSLQIGQPAWIAERTGLPVVADLRARDIAAGGQGAPLVSFMDAMLLADRGRRPAALNLGGIANITTVEEGSRVKAWDTGPANALIDAVVRAEGLNGEGFDRGGCVAARGSVVGGLLEVLLADPYYAAAPPKSTGKEVFHLGYVKDALGRYGQEVAAEDLVATLTALTAETVARAARQAETDYLAVSGGGARNPVLMAMLRERLPGVRVALSDELGAPADAKEAILCALIGWCTLNNVPATLPGTTGAEGPRVLGAVTPGARPLIMGPPPGPVRQLRLI